MKLSKSTKHAPPDTIDTTDIVAAPPVPSMLSESQLIAEICEAVMSGATDSAICRALAIYPATFSNWKKKGREGMEPYRTFYIRYEQAKGEREMSWLRGIDDPKWLLTHHPDTKNQFAEVRYSKEERVNTDKLDAKKEALGAEIDKFFGDSEFDEESTDDESETDPEPTVEKTVRKTVGPAKANRP